MNADELVPRIAKALAARLGVDLDKADEIQVEKFLILADVAYIEVHKSGRLVPPESFYDRLSKQWQYSANLRTEE